MLLPRIQRTEGAIFRPAQGIALRKRSRRKATRGNAPIIRIRRTDGPLGRTLRRLNSTTQPSAWAGRIRDPSGHKDINLCQKSRNDCDDHGLQFFIMTGLTSTRKQLICKLRTAHLQQGILWKARFYHCVCKNFSALVNRIVHPRSVVDVGCGRGFWLKEFQQLGAEEVIGIDGSWVDRNDLLIDRNSLFRAKFGKADNCLIEGSIS